jgi:rfaE bifunctional protein nucleotidyltransferase chain/domain
MKARLPDTVMPEIKSTNVLTRDELKEAVAKCRKQNKTIVATNGCFDILHVGHLHLLNQAKALGDILIVGINSDRSVSKLKGAERPVVNENERALMVANLKAVDFVSIFDEDTAVELLRPLKPDIYVNSGNYNLETLPEAQPVMSWGGKVKFVEVAPRKSSTDLIDKIKSLS